MSVGPGTGRALVTRPDGLAGQDGDEVPGPAEQVLVRWAVLAGDLGPQRAARPGGCVELHPLGVDVQFHGDPGAMTRQRLRQVRRAGGHASGVEQVAGRVLAEGAAGDVFTAAERGAPGVPVVGRLGRLAVLDERLQVLADAVHRLARGRRAVPPDADPRPAGPVDDEAGVPLQQRADDVPLLLIAARAHAQLETAVEGGQELLALGAADGGAGLDPVDGCRVPGVLAAVVQDRKSTRL